LPECWGAARLKLTVVNHRDLSWSALAQANFEFKGQPVRAQVGARFFAEASALLVARLGEQLARLADPRQARPWPPQRPRPEPVHQPPAQRRIARTKHYQLTHCDVEQAALLMDVGDHDFYLFTDTASEQDAVIYRVGPTGYRLARLDGLVPPQPRTVLPVTVNVHPVGRYTPAEATTQLSNTELRFVFFRHTHTNRAAAVYRRYDGHYGLIATPEPARRSDQRPQWRGWDQIERARWS
jgi:hypothetical protein